uniref:Uncharacterized protein n=1 Tax=Globodera rostochiensis TaxID=31243 RepID=A0A914HLD5_GLORO
MISFNSNQNLFKFVLFILFCNFCQPTSPKSQSQIEFFKTAHEMLESAPNAIFENNLVANGIEGISITNWLYKYSGVMCSENFDEKIEKDGQNDILDGTAEKDDSFCTQRQNVDNAKFLIQRRRRRKRMERPTTFDIEQVGGEAPSIHTYTPCTPLVCAFFTAVGAIALVIMMYPFNYVFYGDPAPKFVALFVMALLLLFAAIGSFIYHRCACYMAFRIRYLANRPPI